MSFANRVFPDIPRQSVVGHEGEWVKMFDPPTTSPPTPELLSPTNPVPEVMLAAGFQSSVTAPHTVRRRLYHGVGLTTWDNRSLNFFQLGDADNPTASGGTYPAPTIHVPRGAVFHGTTTGNPPPHTIHWHGIEPTPLNDGVGHCSMEIGGYIYQWQPNFMGTYFYHCHRNTVQHFEFGLFGALLIDPPDAFFASCQTDPNGPPGSLVLNSTPIGNGRPEPGFPQGRRRTTGNLTNFPQFPGFNSNAKNAPDPEANNPNLPAWLKFQTDPHAMTIPYDVEALWVPDDRDFSQWSVNASADHQTFPRHGSTPGVNDQFNVDRTSWAAFNQFNSDYFFITGVPVPAARADRNDANGNPGTGRGTIPENVVAPAALNSGVPGLQVSINAQVNQTILIRALQAAYNTCRITLPVDAVIISVDGRALGVPPYGTYNHPFMLPANTPIRLSVARRAEALVRVSSPMRSFAKIEWFDTRAENPLVESNILFTAMIPFNISAAPAGAFSISGTITPAQAGVSVAVTGAVIQNVAVDAATGAFTVSGLSAGSYTLTPSKAGVTFGPSPSLNVTITTASVTGQNFTATAAAAGTFKITGAVLGGTGGPVVGVQVNLVGSTNGIAVTDAAGKYVFSGLANGRYTLIPSATGFRFFPRERTVNISGADQMGMFFEAE